MHHLTAQVNDGFNHVFGNYGTDAMYLTLILAIFFFYAFFRGNNKMVSLMFSFYVAGVLYLLFPYAKTIASLQFLKLAGAWSVFIVYLAIVIIIHFFLNRMIVVSEAFGRARLGDAIILSITTTVGLLALTTTILPFGRVFALSQPLTSVLSQPITAFVAILLPLLAIWWTNR